MRLRPTLLSVVLAVAACSTRERKVATPKPAGSATRIDVRSDARSRADVVDEDLGFAVLEEGAALLDTPGSSAVAWTRGGTVRVLSRERGFVQVETIALDPEVHCQPGYSPHDGLALRVWVDVASLLPVIREPTTIRFDDGTAIRLVAGTPIEIENGVVRGVRLGAAVVEVPVPDPAVSRFFLAAPDVVHIAWGGKISIASSTSAPQLGGIQSLRAPCFARPVR